MWPEPSSHTNFCAVQKRELRAQVSNLRKQLKERDARLENAELTIAELRRQVAHKQAKAQPISAVQHPSHERVTSTSHSVEVQTEAEHGAHVQMQRRCQELQGLIAELQKVRVDAEAQHVKYQQRASAKIDTLIKKNGALELKVFNLES